MKTSALPQFKKNNYNKEIIDYVVELIQTKRKSMPEIVEEYRIYSDLIAEKYPERMNECIHI